MILFPSGGMAAEDIGDSQKQNPALESVSNPGNAKSDGDLPSIAGVSNFGNGPEVIKNKGGDYCSPGYEGKPGAA